MSADDARGGRRRRARPAARRALPARGARACPSTRRPSGSCARPAARSPSTARSASARRCSRSPATPRCAPRSRSSPSAASASTPRSCSPTSRRRSPGSASRSTSRRASARSSSSRSARWPTSPRFRPFEPEAAVAPLLDAIRLVRRESPVPLIGFAGAPFTLACYLVEGGPSRDFVQHQEADARASPRPGPALLDRPRRGDASAYLRAQVDAGAEAVQVFDSWVGGLSPLDYERRLMPWMTPPVRRASPGSASRAPTSASGRRACSSSRRPPAATSSGSTGGSRWPRAGGSSATGRCRATSTRCCCSGPWAGVEEGARWVLDAERPASRPRLQPGARRAPVH